MKHFDVTLLFCKGGSYGARFFAKSKVAAKAQAIKWARECGFIGTLKEATVIEILKVSVCDENIHKNSG
jgi:hypothetical protein